MQIYSDHATALGEKWYHNHVKETEYNYGDNSNEKTDYMLCYKKWKKKFICRGLPVCEVNK